MAAESDSSSGPPREATAARRLAMLGALLGAFASAYLLIDYAWGSGICLTGSGCDVVRQSPFAYPLGVPMPALGLAFYTACVILLLVGARRDRLALGISTRAATTAMAAVGLLAMAALTAIELAVIRAVCSTCLLSAVGSVLLAAGAWRMVRASPNPPDEPPRRTGRARREAEACEQGEWQGFVRLTAAATSVLAVVLAGLVVLPVLSSDRAVGAAPDEVAARPRTGEGPMELVVFSDFQCPACARVAPMLRLLAAEGSVTLVYRYFPLTGIHANALAAAQAAEAAHRQGAFWAYHDRIFASQSVWSGLGADAADAIFEQLASDLGLNVERWRLDRVAAADSVAADLATTARLALPGTPSIFIGGIRYTGPNTIDGLRAAAGVRG